MQLDSAAGYRLWHIRYQVLNRWQQVTSQRQLLRICLHYWSQIPRRIRRIPLRRYFAIWKRRHYADVWLKYLTIGTLRRAIVIWRAKTFCERSIVQNRFDIWAARYTHIRASTQKSVCFYNLRQQKKMMTAWINCHRDIASRGEQLFSHSCLAVKAQFWKRLKLICRARWRLHHIIEKNMIRSYWAKWNRHRTSLNRNADCHLRTRLIRRTWRYWKYCHHLYRTVFQVIILDHSARLRSACFMWRQVTSDRRSLRRKAFRIWRSLHSVRLTQNRTRFRIRSDSFYSWLMLLYHHHVYCRFVFSAFQKWKFALVLRRFQNRRISYLLHRMISVWWYCSIRARQMKTNDLAALRFHREKLLAKFVWKWGQLFQKSTVLRQFIAQHQLNVKAQYFTAWNQLWTQITVHSLSETIQCTATEIDHENQTVDLSVIEKKPAQISQDNDPLFDAMSRHHYRLGRERACFRNWVHYCRILRFYREIKSKHNRQNAVQFLVSWRRYSILQRNCNRFSRRDVKKSYWEAWQRLMKLYRQARLFRQRKRLRFHLRKWRQARLKKLHSLRRLFSSWHQTVLRRRAMDVCRLVRVRRVWRHWMNTRKLIRFVARRHFRIWRHAIRQSRDLVFEFLVQKSKKRKRNVFIIWRCKLGESAVNLKRKYIVNWHKKLHWRKKDLIGSILLNWNVEKHRLRKSTVFRTWMIKSRDRLRFRQIAQIHSRYLQAMSFRAIMRLHSSSTYNRKIELQRIWHLWKLHFSLSTIDKQGRKIIQKWVLHKWQLYANGIRETSLKKHLLNSYFRIWQQAISIITNSRQAARTLMDQVLGEMKAIRRRFRYGIIFNRLRLCRWIFSIWKRCLLNEQTKILLVANDFIKRKYMSRWWQRYVDGALEKRWDKLNQCTEPERES